MNIVSFVILHYRDLESTSVCVRSILRMEQQERIRIVVVDNDIDVPRETREQHMCEYREYGNVELLFVQEDGGFSYANNQGYVFARRQQDASFIVMLNNDIKFTQTDFVRRLDKAYAKHPCHVLGPDIVRSSTGEHQNPLDTRLRTKEEAEYTVRMNRRALKWYPLLYPILHWNNRRMQKRTTRERIAQKEFRTSAQEDVVPCGACLIFTPEFVRSEEKAFWPETRFFYEEYILALRCRRNGYKIWYDPSLMAFHESGIATQESHKSEKARLRFQMERIAEAAEVYLKVLSG